MGKSPGNGPWGWGSRAGPTLLPSPSSTFLPPSEHNENNVFALPKISLGRKRWVRRIFSASHLSRCKAQEHAGLEILTARSPGTYAGGNKRAPKAPANWSEHMESDPAQSSLLYWSGPTSPRGSSPAQGTWPYTGGRQGQPALLG